MGGFGDNTNLHYELHEYAQDSEVSNVHHPNVKKAMSISKKLTTSNDLRARTILKNQFKSGNKGLLGDMNRKDTHLFDEYDMSQD